MKRKFIVSFFVACCVFTGPVAADLDSAEHFNQWYQKQFASSESFIQKDLITHTVITAFEWADWTKEMDVKIQEQLDVTDLITTKSERMKEYADQQKNRIEEAKNSLHMNEIDALISERKENLPAEMEDELASYFKTEFLTGE